MKVEYVIVGGGIAGLSAALALAEKGAEPLLIEAGMYPCHKVCGEFISPETIPFLQRWNIFPELIHQAHFRTPSQEMLFSFPTPAGSLSHLQLDPLLAREAQRLGTRLMTNTRVESWSTQQLKDGISYGHELILSDGQTIQAKHLLLATGRIPSLQTPPFQATYLGFKAHFRGIALSSTLEMFSTPGIYLGIVPVEDGLYNLAGLARLSMVEQAGSLDCLIASVRRIHPLLDGYLSEAIPQFNEWMQVKVPEFGIKRTIPLPRTYYIGDAALTVPPACGNGLSLAIQSGCLAAQYALRDDSVSFRSDWQKRI
jgi:menaquinone-9 beta-reductase